VEDLVRKTLLLRCQSQRVEVSHEQFSGAMYRIPRTGELYALQSRVGMLLYVFLSINLARCTVSWQF